MARVLITGGGGFVGSHLADYLHKRRNFVRVADVHFNGYHEAPYYSERLELDLRTRKNCLIATDGMDVVYNFAANMGGIGFISKVGAEIMHDNTLINTNMLEAAHTNQVKKYMFSSSACVYPDFLQRKSRTVRLKEDDAYPAKPDTFYGWEKLTAEKMCEAYQQDFNMDIRIVRYHNIFGPKCTYKGGREKSPAALCRKVSEASDPGTIKIWGDGKQTRSYCYIDDAVKGTVMLMNSDYDKPVNLGSDRLVSIDDLTSIIIKVSGKRITKEYDTAAPQGVRGRNADISVARRKLGWEPEVPLEKGLAATYHWIDTMCTRDRTPTPLLRSVVTE